MEKDTGGPAVYYGGTGDKEEQMLTSKLRDRLLLKIVEPLITEWIKPRAVLKTNIDRDNYKEFAKHIWKYVDAIIEEKNNE